jgi:hypothetical protein
MGYPSVFSEDFACHESIKVIKSIVKPHLFNSYFKFGFVRNPWDWQVSMYCFMLKNKDHFQHKLVSKMKNFDEYIEWRINDALIFQKSFFYDDDNLLVDFVGKYESLFDDFNYVENKIGVKTALGHHNRSRLSGDFLKYYTPDSIEKIYQAYQADILAFNYKKPLLK